MRKSILTASVIVILILIGGGAVWYAKSQKPGPVNPPVAKNGQIATTTEPIAISTSEIDIANWLTFDSEKDSGTKLHFSLIYPNDWLHFGSIDGGQFSNIPFYRKDLYVKKCEIQSNGAKTCKEEGKAAEISVSIESLNLNEPGNIGEKYYIGDNAGFILAKTLETNKTDPHIFISNKVFQFSLAKINGMKFTFTMVQEDNNSKNIFYKILESIKFR